MTDTRIIFLEGLPGTGKTTNSAFLRIQLERNGIPADWIHEVTRPHPTQFFDEASLTFDEYDSLKKIYPEAAPILDSFAVFRKTTVGFDLLEAEWNYLEKLGKQVFQALKEYDTWNFPLEDYKTRAVEKWELFAEQALRSDDVTIIDGGVFQFPIWAFLFENSLYGELEDFVGRLFAIVRPLRPRLIYFYRENTDQSIAYLENERGTGYLESIASRDENQPYYRDKPQGAAGFRRFLRDYADWAARLFASAPCPKLGLEITAGDWPRYEDEMLDFLRIGRKPDPPYFPPGGVYRNDQLDMELSVSGSALTDPEGKTRRLTPKSAAEFYVENLPTLLCFGQTGQAVTAGRQINARWTATGTVFQKTE